MAMVNSREHRVTRRRPDHMLAEETSALHRIPATAHTVAYGVGRKVPENTPMVSFENAQYSVPAHLLGAEVFVRHHGTGPDSMVVIMHAGAQGPVDNRLKQWRGIAMRSDKYARSYHAGLCLAATLHWLTTTL